MGDTDFMLLENSLASAKIEGFSVSEQTVQDCIRLLNGEISVAELVNEVLLRPNIVG